MALIDKKLTDLTEKLSVPDDAFIHIVDVSDTSQSPAGSSYKARKSTISGTVKAQTGVSGTVKTNSNSVDPIVYLKSEVDALVAGKQNTLGFTPENVANKQSNLDEDLSGLKYPNVTAVKGGLSTKADVTALNLKADKSNTYTKLEVDNLIEEVDLAGKEDISNKTSSFATLSTTTYPNSKALSDGLATKIGGSGTIGFIPKFGVNGLENSSLKEENTFIKSTKDLLLNSGNYVILGNENTGIFYAIGYEDGLGQFVFRNGRNGQVDLGINNLTQNIFTGTTDNGVDKLQIGGTISASPATLSNQVVVKSQLDLKANLASPALTGTPTAPTATAGTNTTQIATTAFVQANTNANGLLEFNAVDRTVWNNGQGDVATNTSFGASSLRSNTTGQSNTSYGVQSLSNLTSGNTNTSIGRSAGLTTSVGNLTTSNGSVFVGSFTSPLNDNETNQIVIGTSATGAGSNTATLGNASITRTILRGTVEAGNATANNHLATLGQVKSRSGWASYSTTTYTNASPFVIAPNTTVTLPNNANNSITTELPLGVTAFYNGTTNKITPAAIGDAYTVNVRFKARTTMNNDYLTLFIDIGNGSQINAEAKQFLKGANTEQPFSFTMPIFTLATFVANGGEIKVSSNGGTISIYDVTFYINRNYTR